MERLNYKIDKTKNPEKQEKLKRKHICSAIAMKEGWRAYFYPGISKFGQGIERRIEDLIHISGKNVIFTDEKGEPHLSKRNYRAAVKRYKEIFKELYNSNKTIGKLMDFLLLEYRLEPQEIKDDFCYIPRGKNEKLSKDTTIL